jgi:hypothetical protein
MTPVWKARLACIGKWYFRLAAAQFAIGAIFGAVIALS